MFTGATGVFRCLMIKSSSFIIDLTGSLVDDVEIVGFKVVIVVEVVVRAFVDVSSSKSSMKLVKFVEIFLKLGIVLGSSGL